MRHVVFIVVAVSIAVAQAPLPEALLRARTAYITSDGVDRQWLNRFAAALRKAKRFEIVSDIAAADVVMTLARGKGTSAYMPLAGTSIVIGGDNEAFHLIVSDPTTKTVLWDDHREASWTVGGAVDALSKRLHDELKRYSAPQR